MRCRASAGATALAAIVCLSFAPACPGVRPKTDFREPDWPWVTRYRDGSLRRDGGSTITSFSDVPADHPFAKAISWTVAKHYLAPCKTSPPAFCPDDPVQRDWAAKSVILMKFGESFNASTTPYFVDVPASYWAFRYIQKLAELKVTNGCGDGTSYCPTATLSRAQAAALLIRTKFGENFTPTATPYFTDVPADYWAFRYIQKAYDEGITYGCNQGSFCPDQPITRAQWSAFLYRLQTL